MSGVICGQVPDCYVIVDDHILVPSRPMGLDGSRGHPPAGPPVEVAGRFTEHVNDVGWPIDLGGVARQSGPSFDGVVEGVQAAQVAALSEQPLLGRGRGGVGC